MTHSCKLTYTTGSLAAAKTTEDACHTRRWPFSGEGREAASWDFAASSQKNERYKSVTRGHPEYRKCRKPRDRPGTVLHPSNQHTLLPRPMSCVEKAHRAFVNNPPSSQPFTSRASGLLALHCISYTCMRRTSVVCITGL